MCASRKLLSIFSCSLLWATMSCAPATDAAEEIPDAVDDSMAEVTGLPSIEDLDPALDVVEYELTIGVSEVEMIPGKVTEVWTYNGTYPGPLLRARVGDTVRVHATNLLAEPTTIHWHGLRIDWRMDGVVHGDVVSIAPGESFTYEFVVPEAGTFWYHPHVRSTVQVEAGLQGMFVVFEKEDVAPDVDADQAFIFDDVRLTQNGEIAAHSTSGPDIVHGRAGNMLLVNGKTGGELTLGAGRVERWRLVNTANARTLFLRFPGLKVREIGADGGLWPQWMTREITTLMLPVGARAELEVRLVEGQDSASVDAIVLASDGQGNVVQQPLTLLAVTGDASLDVEAPRAGHTADERFQPIAPDLWPTHRIELAGENRNGVVVFTINGQEHPNVDLWQVPQGEMQIIEIENLIGPEHPFHLHGQFFQVLTRDGRVANEIGWRDTVLIEGFSTVTIATDFSNPGMWMYHCHILEHGENGMMAMVEVVDTDSP